MLRGWVGRWAGKMAQSGLWVEADVWPIRAPFRSLLRSSHFPEHSRRHERRHSCAIKRSFRDELVQATSGGATVKCSSCSPNRRPE